MRLNYANFNQDNSCVCAGYDTGFRIYECENFTKCYEEMEGGISIVEMLCNSSLVAVVGSGETSTALSRRRLRMINTKQHTTICELTFPGAIIAVRMNLERLIVLVEGMLYIYDITKMRLLHTIEVNNTGNSKGLVALSMASNVVYACEGDVIVFDCKKLEAVAVIAAHRREVTALAINHDGTLISTASDRGTLIRVFDAESGVKIKQFRRGTYPTKISALSFSEGWLIANSGTGTIHVFKIDGENEEGAMDNESEHNVAADDAASVSSDEDFPDSTTNSNSNTNTNPVSNLPPTSSMGRILRRTSQTLGRRAAQSMGPLLPPRVLGVLEPARHFASCKLPPGSSTPTGLVGLSYDRVVGVTETGEVLVYGLDKTKGGDCQLLETSSIV